MAANICSILDIRERRDQIKELGKKVNYLPVWMIALFCFAVSVLVLLYLAFIDKIDIIMKNFNIWLWSCLIGSGSAFAFMWAVEFSQYLKACKKRKELRLKNQALHDRLLSISDVAYSKLRLLNDWQTQGTRLMLSDSDGIIRLLFKKGFIKRKSDREIIVGDGEFCHDYFIDEDVSEYLSINTEL